MGGKWADMCSDGGGGWGLTARLEEEKTRFVAAWAVCIGFQKQYTGSCVLWRQDFNNECEHILTTC